MPTCTRTEDIGKKGGNNVGSLLMHHLERQSIPQQQSEAAAPFKEINIVMDNCGGQNKNRHVLRLLHILVKQRVATTAKAIFLVRGHTKNDCDCLFNTMKRNYRKSNCFTPDDLFQQIHHEQVEPIMVGPDFFGNWDALEVIHINAPTGETKTNHVFAVDINKNNGNSMQLQVSDGSVESELLLVRQEYHEHDVQYWRSLQPQPIPAVGLVDIKWRELNKKWGPFVPQDKRQQWIYYRQEPPASTMKDVARKQKEAQIQLKTRTRTVHEDNTRKLPAKKPRSDSSDKPPYTVAEE